MRRYTGILATTALVVGLVAAACSSSPQSSTTTTPSATTTTTSAPVPTSSPAPPTTTAGSRDLQSLIPTPANSQRTDGPDSIHDNGFHKHFLVNGAPTDVMGGYKTALEGAGWSLTVRNSGGAGGGGGATYTGTNGDAYGVFTGGGYGGTTDVNACAWPAKPSDTDCGSGNGR